VGALLILRTENISRMETKNPKFSIIIFKANSSRGALVSARR